MSTTSSSTVAVANASRVSVAPRQAKRGRRLIMGVVLVIVVAVLFFGGRSLGLFEAWGTGGDDSAIHIVEPTTLNVSLKEDGELKPVNSVAIKCEVEAQGFQRGLTIKSVVEESTAVKKGDLLVELTSDEMKDRLESEEIELRQIGAALENAREALAITRSDNASRIKKAEIDLEVAILELDRYTLGEFENRKTSIDIAIKQTEMLLTRAKEEQQNSIPLLEKGFVTQAKMNELDDEIERLTMTKRMHDLEKAILESYEHRKNDMQKTSAVEQAREELGRETQRAASREKQGVDNVANQDQTFGIRQRRFERMKAQLEKCRILAPVDGVVQYGGTEDRWRWGGNRIAAGEQVQPGQTLITIPDTSQMMVSTRIHEADRHMTAEGMTCIVTVPAVPGRTFTGKLTKVTHFADSERSWWNPELKEHAAEILLDESDTDLSPGDSASIEIMIEELIDVLAVPVQCVYSRGAQHYVFRRSGLTAAPVEVELGATTTTMVEIKDGLARGDKVVMAPDERMLALLPPVTVEEQPQAPAAPKPGPR